MPEPLTLRKDNPDLRAAPADQMPPVDRGDVTNLDEDHLRGYIMSAFRNMVADKQDHGWVEKKTWAYKAYYGVKNEAMKRWPWIGASAFPAPLTPTLTDTAWANVQSGLWSSPNGPSNVTGTQDEDLRPAKILEKFQNWQIMHDTNLEIESDKNVFRTFLDGTGILKTMFDLRTGKIRVYSIDLENFFVPIDASGLQKDGTDILIQIVPLSYNDVQIRKAMRIYRDPDAIIPGIGVELRDADKIRRTMDQASGVSMDTKVRRENYYVMEAHLSYIPPGSFRPRDLITWISPNGGTIQRIREKKDGRRPFSDAHAYPYPGRFYSMGIPEKVKNEQEKIDYSDKQYTDSLDRSNNPAAFVDDTESFDRTRQQRVLGGIYEKGKGNTIQWEPQPPVERGWIQERALIWEMAERKTGIIDITQGRPSAFGGKTLGEIEIRSARADVRFSNVFKRVGKQYADVFRQMYELTHEFMPKARISEIIGHSTEGYSMEEIFPVRQGRLVNWNFGFSGALESDRNAENARKVEYYKSKLGDPELDKGTRWRIEQEIASAMGVRGAESVIPQPREASLIGAQEFIKRVVSGQRDIKIRPGIDVDDYIFEILLFEKSEIYPTLEPFQKQMLADTLRRVEEMGKAERQAQIDLMLVAEQAKFGAMQEQVLAKAGREEPPA